MPDLAPNAAGRFGRLGWLWLSVLVLVIDQASKHYFEGSLTMYQQIVVIPDYFSWTLAYNTGAAFSFLTGHTEVLSVVAIVATVVVLWTARRLGSTGWAIAPIAGSTSGGSSLARRRSRCRARSRRARWRG